MVKAAKPPINSVACTQSNWLALADCLVLMKESYFVSQCPEVHGQRDTALRSEVGFGPVDEKTVVEADISDVEFEWDGLGLIQSFLDFLELTGPTGGAMLEEIPLVASREHPHRPVFL